MEQWPEDDIIGVTDCNVGFISGGQAINALAEKAEAFLMFRLVTQPEVVMEQLQKICGKYSRTKIELVTKNGTVDMLYADKILDGKKWNFGTACFNTDIPYFDNKRTKCFLYGHGDICDAHCPREYIWLDDLYTCVEKY